MYPPPLTEELTAELRDRLRSDVLYLSVVRRSTILFWLLQYIIGSRNYCYQTPHVVVAFTGRSNQIPEVEPTVEST